MFRTDLIDLIKDDNGTDTYYLKLKLAVGGLPGCSVHKLHQFWVWCSLLTITNIRLQTMRLATVSVGSLTRCSMHNLVLSEMPIGLLH